jgi:hypothetical protein
MTDPTNSRYRYLHFRDSTKYRRFKQEDNSSNKGKENFVNQEVPNHGTYGALLFHPLWKSRREEILRRDKFLCVICSGTKTLQVHHRQYHFIVKANQFRLPWDYSENLLVTLCESCHKRGHNKFKVPTINI